MEISVKIQKIIAIDDEENSDTVQLKAEILDNTGISSSRQELIVTADALEDGITLDGLSIDKGSTLQLLLVPSTKIIKISIISVGHETITLKEKASETIENIKAKVWNKIGISKDLQQLFLTKELEDSRTLADYNIQNESILALKIKGELRIFVKTKDNIRDVGVKSTDTVDYVKHKLQLKEGSAPGTQRLAFAGKQLEGDRSLAYYKIENDSTLELVSCGCSEMQIHVCILRGKVFSLQVESIDTIGNVKAKIQAKERIPVNLQLLIFDGKVLVDNLTLADFGIQTKSTLGLIICRFLPK